MLQTHSLEELLLYLLLYSFIGWAIGAVCIGLKERKFVNRGLLNLPFAISEGITAVILLHALPTLEGHPVYQYFLTWVLVYMMDELTGQFMKNVSCIPGLEMGKSYGFSRKEKLILRSAEAMLYLIGYLLIHPFIYLFVQWLPNSIVMAIVWISLVAVVLDFLGNLYALRAGRSSKLNQNAKTQTHRLGNKLSDHVWKRLDRAYPGVESLRIEESDQYIFAQGICFDKLVWVFLISSFLGAMIEMVYCRAMGDIWMNRSSVLYGVFSFVWGFGAVLLTIVLQKTAHKPDRHVFLVGAVVGGVYEYLCSVFTEIAFGTVFWDYSEMPMNIGGRTNLVFCVFWGLLAVLWIKVLYPPMERWIEKLPVLLGKILTWCIVAAMLVNGMMTSAAMIRYTQRAKEIAPSGSFEQFLDERYPDDWMEHRWPNMDLTA